MISVLVPSRGRPDNIRRLYQSLVDTTFADWELLVRLDEDDPARSEYEQPVRQTNVTGPRKLMADLWNDLIRHSEGGILMLCGDDVTFNTKHWDRDVVGGFSADGIGLVHGNDLSPNSEKIATHPFVSKRWVDTVGALAPPYFVSDYVDLWLTEVADALGRRTYLPDVVFEHHHFAFGKALKDQTYIDRLERHRQGNVERVWKDTAGIRQRWVDLLRTKMQP